MERAIADRQWQDLHNAVGWSSGPTVQAGVVHGGLHLHTERGESRLALLLVALLLVCVVLGARANP